MKFIVNKKWGGVPFVADVFLHNVHDGNAGYYQSLIAERTICDSLVSRHELRNAQLRAMHANNMVFVGVEQNEDGVFVLQEWNLVNVKE